jgi:hypothetical protein
LGTEVEFKKSEYNQLMIVTTDESGRECSFYIRPAERGGFRVQLSTCGWSTSLSIRPMVSNIIEIRPVDAFKEMEEEEGETP